MDTIIYVLVTTLMIASIFGILVSRNPVHSILYLILTFTWFGAFKSFFGSRFFSRLVMIVYIGAIAVLLYIVSTCARLI